MQYGARWDVMRAKNGKTLSNSCLKGLHADCLHVLKPYVQDWNLPDTQGNTPLHLVQSMHELVPQLVALGADPNRSNNAEKLRCTRPALVKIVSA